MEMTFFSFLCSDKISRAYPKYEIGLKKTIVTGRRLFPNMGCYQKRINSWAIINRPQWNHQKQVGINTIGVSILNVLLTIKHEK